MKKIKATQEIEVFLTEQQTKHIVADFLKEKLNWGDDYFIEDGSVMKTQTYHSSHSWTNKIKIREASELDRALHVILDKINNNL